MCNDQTHQNKLIIKKKTGVTISVGLIIIFAVAIFTVGGWAVALEDKDRQQDQKIESNKTLLKSIDKKVNANHTMLCNIYTARTDRIDCPL